ncbi:MAG: thermonuclease family protein [Anaerolineae bacterium]|nr:thermonuclease family protein [Anaerolineae bacterium]
MTKAFTLTFILAILLTAACNPADQPTPTIEASPTPSPLPPTATFTSGPPTKTPRPTPSLPEIPEVACIPADGVRTSGIVTGVIDGDTIDVTIGNLTFRVRYLGLDTPETRNPDTGIERMGKDASQRNLELLKGQRVTLVSDPNDNDTDQYGRQLRYVIVGDIFVNYQLIREGLAFLYSSPIQCGPLFFQAWEAARAEKIGLYAPTPTPEN